MQDQTNPDAGAGSETVPADDERLGQTVDDLERLVRDHVLATMYSDPTGELAKQSLADQLITHGAWLARFVPRRPRRVHRSAELSASAKATEHSAALKAIVEKIERGEYLTPHLSRGVNVAYESGADSGRTPLGRRRDRHLLIADWNIHHLHLSTTLEPDGFVTPTGDLLFAAFALDDVYLIGIYPHGSWALKDLITVVVRNWPEAGIVHEMRGITGVSPEPTDEERLQLRTAGVTGPIAVDGKVYMTFGQTTAGTPMKLKRNVNAVMHTLRELRENGAASLAEIARSAGLESSAEWEAANFDGLCGLRCGNQFLPVANLSREML
jgi:hypothetical protein